MKLNKDDLAIICFWELGERCLPTELANGELPPQVKDLEKFVCQVWCSTSLPALSWELFHNKNLEGDILPPTWAALLPHAMCTNYIAMYDKSYTTPCPALPSIGQIDWNVENGLYVHVRCLTLPALLDVTVSRKILLKKMPERHWNKI